MGRAKQLMLPMYLDLGRRLPISWNKARRRWQAFVLWIMIRDAEYAQHWCSGFAAHCSLCDKDINVSVSRLLLRGLDFSIGSFYTNSWWWDWISEGTVSFLGEYLCRPGRGYQAHKCVALCKLMLLLLWVSLKISFWTPHLIIS